MTLITHGHLEACTHSTEQNQHQVLVQLCPPLMPPPGLAKPPWGQLVCLLPASSPYHLPPSLFRPMGNLPHPQACGLGRLTFLPSPRDPSVIGSESICDPSSASEIQLWDFHRTNEKKLFLFSKAARGSGVAEPGGKACLSMEPTQSRGP